MAKMITPPIGQQVLYIDPRTAKSSLALVQQVNADTTVSLWVMGPGTQTYTAIAFWSPDNIPGTWNWPFKIPGTTT